MAINYSDVFEDCMQCAKRTARPGIKAKFKQRTKESNATFV